MSSWNMNVWLSAGLNRMTTAQVVKTSVPVNNSRIQDYVHPDYDIPPTTAVGTNNGNERVYSFLG